MIQTTFTTAFGVRAPVVSAPMGGVAGPALVAAVTRAGGLGLLGVETDGSATPARLVEQADRARVEGRVSFGLITWLAEARPELLDAVLGVRPHTVALSFGDPAPLASAIRASGALLICQVQDEGSARQALRAGADAIVAQGNEAGGHTGGTGTLSLLQSVLQLAEPYGTPVLASGGIATGPALAAVLAAGASGAWVGTRFYATQESDAHPEAKRRILQAHGDSTVYTKVFDVASQQPWPAHLAGRALRNDFVNRWHGREDDISAGQPGPRRELAEAKARTDFAVAPVWAGQAASVINDEPTAGQVVEDLVAGAERAITRAAALMGISAQCGN